MERFQLGSDQIVVQAASEETGGALLALEVHMPPGGGPPAMHRHAAAEIYRVERGELTVHLGDADGSVRRVPAAPGGVVAIPGGTPHTVRNESDAEATAYVVFSPGTEMEGFLRAAAALDAPTPDDVMAIAARHGVELAR